MAVEVTTTPAFDARPPKLLFRTADRFPAGLAGDTEYSGYGSISSDGERFAFRVPMPPELKAVKVATEILAQYAGTYVSSTQTWVVTLEGDQLRFQDSSTGGRNTFIAESETSFFLRNRVQAHNVEFVKDDKGAVTHFIAYFGNGGTTFTRQ